MSQKYPMNIRRRRRYWGGVQVQEFIPTLLTLEIHFGNNTKCRKWHSYHIWGVKMCHKPCCVTCSCQWRTFGAVFVMCVTSKSSLSQAFCISQKKELSSHNFLQMYFWTYVHWTILSHTDILKLPCHLWHLI